MASTFSQLSANDLRTLADALRSGRLIAPYNRSLVGRTNISPSCIESVVDALSQLDQQGFSENQIAILLSAIVDERKSSQKLEELINLVITGPEAPGTAIRDTGVVVRELFRSAKKSVVVVGYSVYQGQKVFAELANRMSDHPLLVATMYLNLPPIKGVEEESIIAHRFARDFRTKHWPDGCRLPRVYFDPRSVAVDRSKRASLHAKCVIVDEKELFISSANFTERAQDMNVEVGVRFASETLARQLANHFQALVNLGALKQLSFPG